MTPDNSVQATGAVILAGGQARRMQGCDKGLVQLQGRPLIEWVYQRVRPQVAEVLINANRNQQEYARLGVPVVADELSGFHGPLAGLATALVTLNQPYVFMCPCDSPLLGGTMVERLYQAIQEANASIAVAHDGSRLQPVFCLVRRTVEPSLNAFLARGERKIDRWYAEENTVTVDFSDETDSFRNINTEEERLALESELTDAGGFE